jgi:hypothetical protein
LAVEQRWKTICTTNAENAWHFRERAFRRRMAGEPGSSAYQVPAGATLGVEHGDKGMERRGGFRLRDNSYEGRWVFRGAARIAPDNYCARAATGNGIYT